MRSEAAIGPDAPLERAPRLVVVPTADRSATRPFVVELVGTPGAGKTTVAADLTRHLEESGFAATSVRDAGRRHAARTPPGRFVQRGTRGRVRRALLWQVFYAYGVANAVAFAREEPALARWVWSTQRRRPIAPRMRRHVLFWFAQLMGRRRFLVSTGTSREALVFDDGFVHRAVALHASHLEAPDPRTVARYVDLVPPPDALVHVVAPLDVCERRVHARGVWAHSRHLDREELRRSLEHAARAVDAAVARARELGWTVIEIDNGQDRDRSDCR
jgi:deoxyadenosine/deoxycytidine kinase